MLNRAAPVIAAYDTALTDNIFNFDAALQREIRSINTSKQRDNASTLTAKFIADAKSDSNHIPAQLAAGLPGVKDFTKIHKDYLNRQKTMDESFKKQMDQLSALYTVGLEQQIERLKSENDPLAIKLIEAEVRKTRDVKSYFNNLMLGVESDEDFDEDSEDL